jgi:hypothetical protein
MTAASAAAKQVLVRAAPESEVGLAGVHTVGHAGLSEAAR